MSQIEQKVSVSVVTIGMYICRLDRPWLETRYLFQGFHISNSGDIEELRQSCEYVFVDPDRGESAALPLKKGVHKGPSDKFMEVFNRAAGHERYPVVTSVEEEIGACRESRKHTLETVTSILEQLKAGHSIKLHAVRKAVNRLLADSTQR
jgi:hypothetical protein